MSDLIAAIASTVVFLFADGGQVPLGTGFIVGVPAGEENSKNLLIPVIVTARHVVANQERIVARFSAKSGTQPMAVLFNIADLKSAGDFWPHPDDGVDIVAFRTPHFGDALYEPLPLELVASRQMFEEAQIKQSDRIIFPSLLVNFMGISRNYPVLRDGSIALIPDENVPIEYVLGGKKISTKQNLLFLNATSIPGASGSPVFLWPGPRIIGNSFAIGGGRPYLLGVIHGFYPASPRELLEVEVNTLKALFQENSGIAIAFPSWRLREILESDIVRRRIKGLVAATSPVAG